MNQIFMRKKRENGMRKLNEYKVNYTTTDDEPGEATIMARSLTDATDFFLHQFIPDNELRVYHYKIRKTGYCCNPLDDGDYDE